MGKHRKPPSRREKAPNQEEQRRYRRNLRRKLRKLRQKKEPDYTPIERPKKFPLGSGFALLIGTLGGGGIALADRMQLPFDDERAFLILVWILILPFILTPLLCRHLRRKYPDSPIAARIDRIDMVLGSGIFLLYVSGELISLVVKIFHKISGTH